MPRLFGAILLALSLGTPTSVAGQTQLGQSPFAASVPSGTIKAAC
jgi:hypothetical protein